MLRTRNSRVHHVLKLRKRRTWGINPATRVHSTPKGKKGYSRRHGKKTLVKELSEIVNRKGDTTVD